jgi:hypothetical protein
MVARGGGAAVMALMPLIVGRLDEGLRREIKEGNQARGVNTSLGISRSEVGRHGAAGGDGRKQQRSAGAGGRRN